MFHYFSLKSENRVSDLRIEFKKKYYFKKHVNREFFSLNPVFVVQGVIPINTVSARIEEAHARLHTSTPDQDPVSRDGPRSEIFLVRKKQELCLCNKIEFSDH